MDGAWALFEAWLRLQLGDIDVALVIGSGRSSPGNNREIFALQGDPYLTAPLGLDPVSLAGIQARALLDANIATEADFAAVVERSWKSAADNPNALVRRSGSVDELLDQPLLCRPPPGPRCGPGGRWRSRPPHGGRRPCSGAVRAAGVDTGDRAPHRVAPPRSPGPDRLAVDPIGGRGGRRAPGHSMWPSSWSPTAMRRSFCAGHWD